MEVNYCRKLRQKLMQDDKANKVSTPQDEQNRNSDLNNSRPTGAPPNGAGAPRGKNQAGVRESARKKMVIKFVKLVGAMVGAFIAAGFIAIMIINSKQGPSLEASNSTAAPSAKISPNPSAPANASERDEQAPAATPDSILLPPLKTNFLVVGKDASGFLTDVIIVGCFDRDTCDINLISIPRDTLTVIPPERLKRMNDLGLYPPSDGTMKINAVNSYGRESYGIALLVEQLKDMLGVDIQYQLEINLQAFRNIVDDLGGVYFYVPEPGMYYDDPYQSLHIAIPPGFQYLDGHAAEGVVRYRETYRDGDIQRISVQQEFLKALFSQVLQRENIIKNAFSISKSIIGYTKTDFSLTDLPMYLRYINDIDPDKIHFYTLPCDPQYLNGVSYVIPNSAQIKELVNDIFYKAEAPGTEISAPAAETAETVHTPLPVISSEGLRIEILNGSGRAGIAGNFQKLFAADGLTVTKVDTYAGVQMNKTQIIVRSEGMGFDLARYFKDSVIQVTPGMPKDYDIIIITGTSEK